MGKPRGFLEIRRSKNDVRPIEERVLDYHEFDKPMEDGKLRDQSARCMDCGIPFCHSGCPLGNLIPEWNDLVMAGRYEEAMTSLLATNNFPEVTGRICPAPCEASCVLNLTNDPVTIKTIEREIADHNKDFLVRPQRSPIRTGNRIAIVGSGPAGLAAAQQLARKGHDVTVFEKSDRLGGLLRYGIPDFKMEKHLIDLRIEQMRQEGVHFRTNTTVGEAISGATLRADYDAILLAAGAPIGRDLKVPGRELQGVHFAMEFLEQQNRRVAGDAEGPRPIVATGKHVVVLGGGDTGSDCVGTSTRQGALSVTSLELMPRLPDDRLPQNPWPEWPMVYRSSSSHEEGGQREFAVSTEAILGERGKVRALSVVRMKRVGKEFVRDGDAYELPCDLLLLAMGFVGSSRDGLVAQLGIDMDARANVKAQAGFATNVAGVFAAGDMHRGQSLVVWAIAEGRQAAEQIDAFLTVARRQAG